MPQDLFADRGEAINYDVHQPMPELDDIDPEDLGAGLAAASAADSQQGAPQQQQGDDEENYDDSQEVVGQPGQPDPNQQQQAQQQGQPQQQSQQQQQSPTPESQAQQYGPETEFDIPGLGTYRLGDLQAAVDFAGQAEQMMSRHQEEVGTLRSQLEQAQAYQQQTQGAFQILSHPQLNQAAVEAVANRARELGLNVDLNQMAPQQQQQVQAQLPPHMEQTIQGMQEFLAQQRQAEADAGLDQVEQEFRQTYGDQLTEQRLTEIKNRAHELYVNRPDAFTAAEYRMVGHDVMRNGGVQPQPSPQQAAQQQLQNQPVRLVPGRTTRNQAPQPQKADPRTMNESQFNQWLENELVAPEEDL